MRISEPCDETISPGDRVPAGRSRLPRFRAFYLRLVNSWIPPAIQTGDAETLRRARLVAALTLVLVALGLEALLIFHWALPAEASRQLELALAAALLLTLLIASSLRRLRSLALAANLLIAASFLVIAVAIFALGGIAAPILHWCALMPMLAVLLGARRSAWCWAAIALATLAGLSYADAAGWRFSNDSLARSQLVDSKLWVQRCVDVSTWIGILFAVALVYERQKDEQTAQLGAINAELTREVAQRKRAEERTHYLAYFDELTTLPNRQHFKQQLHHAMLQAKRAERMAGVLYLDLDGFKEVNDTHGHDLGDLLLREVAQRLVGCVREVDSVARDGIAVSDKLVSRLGGDEFTILLVNIRAADEATLVAKRILRALERPVTLEGRALSITASIGIAMYPSDGDDLDGLLKNADVAMYHAKASGKNSVRVFTQSMLTGVANRTALSNDLCKALERQEFVLHYQPMLDVETQNIVGFEALLRWHHPTRGMLAPGEFIPLAEQTGLIVPVGEWVLREACRQQKQWETAGHVGLRVAVNVSGVQLKGQRLCERVAAILAECGSRPESLELEITENAMTIDEKEVSRTLHEVKGLGVPIALDDFGTGYSSLAYVRRLPVSSLKIDRSFVREIPSVPEARAITTAIIGMAHELNLKVVAEGVETEAQERSLAQHGCDELQGFRFGRPAPAEAAMRILRQN